MLKNEPPNSPNPYNITVNDGIYSFITSQALAYFCIFNNITAFFEPVVGIHDIEVYTFDFDFRDPNPDVRKSGDERISATIKELLRSFFQNKNRTMIYVCDTSDGRAKGRNSLFMRWYREAKGEFICDHLEVTIPDIDMHHGGVIRHAGFPYENVLSKL